MDKFHQRKHYEDLLIKLSSETGLLVHENIKTMSDYQLLSLINYRLIKLDALPMDEDELERDLA